MATTLIATGFRRQRSWSSLGLSVAGHVAVAACAVYVAQAHALNPPQPRNRSIAFVTMAAGVSALIRSTPPPRAGRIRTSTPRPLEPIRAVTSPGPRPLDSTSTEPAIVAVTIPPPVASPLAPAVAPATRAAVPLVVGAFDPAAGSPDRETVRYTVVTAGFDNRASGQAQAATKAALTDGGFDRRQPAPVRAVAAAADGPVESPLEIVFKPVPDYTDEARLLHIEGDVVLDVEFGAAGEVRVLGLVRGLGHGLDEAAARAAAQIRFKPARSAAGAVAVRTIVHIVFRLS